MNADYTHSRLMAALKGLAEGKGRDDVVGVPGFGQQTKILAALIDAQHLKEPFHADHLDVVDAAFLKLGLTRTSVRKDEIAKVVISSLRRG